MKRVVVVGAGASGLIASIFASSNNEVTINTSENIDNDTNNPISENNELKQRIEQLEQELLMLKKQSSNTKISLSKEPINELSSLRKK